MKILVTGSAGFVGFHVARRLLANEHDVLGYDGMTSYYDVGLKHKRNAILLDADNFTFVEAALEDSEKLEEAVSTFAPNIVLHLAAQAGVRYAIENPSSYVSSNISGTFNLLEALRSNAPRHLLIASTSSVYGGNETLPFSETSRTDFPVSLYAATKKATEVMSHSYAHLWNIPTTCFRFFTVFGPWGRPDMALFKFVDAIIEGKPIQVYGDGCMKRDFTYIDDLVEAIERLIATPPAAGQPIIANDSVSPVAPWRSVNIGFGQAVDLTTFIDTIETCLGKGAHREMLPMQQGDMVATDADASLLEALVGHIPPTKLSTGVQAFIEWHKQHKI